MAEHNININTDIPNIRGDIQKDSITDLANKITEAMSRHMDKTGVDRGELRSMVRQVAADVANEVLSRKIKTKEAPTSDKDDLQKRFDNVMDREMDKLFSKLRERGAPVNKRLQEKVKTKVRDTSSTEFAGDITKSVKSLSKLKSSVESVSEKALKAYKVFDKLKSGDVGIKDIQELMGVLRELRSESAEAKKVLKETKDSISDAYGSGSRAAKSVKKKGKAVIERPFESIKETAPTKGEYKEVGELVSKSLKKNLEKSREKDPALDKEIKNLENVSGNAKKLLRSLYKLTDRSKTKTPTTVSEKPDSKTLYKRDQIDAKKLNLPTRRSDKATQETLTSRMKNVMDVYSYEPGVVGKKDYSPVSKMPEGDLKTRDIIKNVENYNKKLEKSLEELQNYISETVEKTMKESGKGWETVTKGGKKFSLSGMGAGESGLKGTNWKMSVANVPAIKKRINELHKQVKPEAGGRGYDPKSSVEDLIDTLRENIIEAEINNIESSMKSVGKRATNYSTSVAKWMKEADEGDFENLVSRLTPEGGGGMSKQDASATVKKLLSKKQAKKGEPLSELSKELEGMYGSEENIGVLRELYKGTYGRKLSQEKMKESGLVKSVEIPAARFSKAGTPYVETTKGSKKSIPRFAEFNSGLESFIEDFNKLANLTNNEIGKLTNEYKKSVEKVGLRPKEPEIGGLIEDRLTKLAQKPKDAPETREYLKEGYKEAASMRAAQLKKSGAIDDVKSFIDDINKTIEQTFSQPEIPTDFVEKFSAKGVRPSDFVKAKDEIQFENIYDVYKKVFQGRDDKGKNLLEEFARNPRSSNVRKLDTANRQVQGLLPLLPDEKSRRGYHQEHVMNLRAKKSDLFSDTVGTPDEQKQLIKDLNIRLKEMIEEATTLPPEQRRKGVKGLDRMKTISTLGLPESQAASLVSYKKGKTLTDTDDEQSAEGTEHLKPLGGIGLKMYTESLPSQAPFKEFQQIGRNITNVTNALSAMEGEFPSLRSEKENRLIQSGRFGSEGYGFNVNAEMRHTPNTFEDQIEVSGKLADVMTETIKKKLFPSATGRVEDASTEKALEGLTVSPVEKGQKLEDVSEKDIQDLNKTIQEVLGVETKYKGRADKALIGDVQKTISKVRDKDVEVQAAELSETFFSHYGRKFTTRYGSKGVGVQPTKVDFKEDLGKQVKPKSMGELVSDMLSTSEGKKVFDESGIGGDISKLKEDFAAAGNKFLISFMRDAEKGIVDENTAKRARDIFNKYTDIIEKLGGSVTGESVEDIKNLKNLYKEKVGGDLTKEVPIDMRISSKGIGKRGLQPEVLETVFGNVSGTEPSAKGTDATVLKEDIDYKRYKELLGSVSDTEKGKEFKPGKLSSISKALGYEGAAPEVNIEEYNKLKEKFMETMDEEQADMAAQVEMLSNYYSDVIEKSGKRRKGLVGPKFTEIIEEPHATEPWSMQQVKNLQKGMKLNIPAYSAYEDIFGKDSALMGELNEGVGMKFQEQLETMKSFLAGPVGGVDPKQKKQIDSMRKKLFEKSDKLSLEDFKTFDASTGSFDQPEELKRSLKSTVFDPEKFPSSGVVDIPVAEDNDIERRRKKPFHLPSPMVRDTYDEPLLAGERGFTKSGRYLNMIIGEAKKSEDIAKQYDEFKAAPTEEEAAGTMKEAGMLDKNVFKDKFKDYLFNRRKQAKGKEEQFNIAAQLKEALNNIGDDFYSRTSPMGRHKKQAENQLREILSSGVENVGEKSLNSAINNSMDVLVGPKTPGENAPKEVKDRVKKLKGKEFLSQVSGPEEMAERLPGLTKPFGGVRDVGKDIFSSAYKERLGKLKDRQLKYQESLSEDVLGKQGSMAEVFFTRRMPAQMGKAVTTVVDKREELNKFSEELESLYSSANELIGGESLSDIDFSDLKNNLEEVRQKHFESIKEYQKEGFTPLKQEELGVPKETAKKIPVSYKKKYQVSKEGASKKVSEPEEVESSLYDLLKYKENISKAIRKASKEGKTSQSMEMSDHLKDDLVPHIESVRYPFTGTSSVKPYKPKLMDKKEGEHGQDLLKDIMMVPGVPDFDYKKFDKVVKPLDKMMGKATEKREAAFESGEIEKAQQLTKFINDLSQAISDIIPRYRALEQKLDFDGDQIEIHSAKTAEARKEIERHHKRLKDTGERGVMNAVRSLKEYEEAAGGGKVDENVLGDMAKSFYKKFDPKEGFDFMSKPFLTEKLDYLSTPEKLDIFTNKKGGSPEGVITDILKENLPGEDFSKINEKLSSEFEKLANKGAEASEYIDKLSSIAGEKGKKVVESGLTDKLHSAKYEDAIEAQIYKTHTGPEVEAITRVKRIADQQKIGKGMKGPVTDVLNPEDMYNEYMNEVMRFSQQKGMDVKHAGGGTVTADIVEALSKKGGVEKLYDQIGISEGGGEGDKLFGELKDLHEGSRKAIETRLGGFDTEALRKQAKEIGVSRPEELDRSSLIKSISEEFDFKGFLRKLSESLNKAAGQTGNLPDSDEEAIDLRGVHDKLFPDYKLRSFGATPENIYKSKYPKSKEASSRDRISAVYDKIFEQLQKHTDIESDTPYQNLIQSGYKNIAEHVKETSDLYKKLQPPEGAEKKDLTTRVFKKEGMSDFVKDMLYKGSETTEAAPGLRDKIEKYSTRAGLPPMSEARKRELTMQHRPEIKKEGQKQYAKGSEELDKFIEEKLEQVYALDRLDKIFEAIRSRKEEMTTISTEMFPRAGRLISKDVGKVDYPKEPTDKSKLEDMRFDADSAKESTEKPRLGGTKPEGHDERMANAREAGKGGRVDKFFGQLKDEDKEYLEAKDRAKRRIKGERVSALDELEGKKRMELEGTGGTGGAGGDEPPKRAPSGDGGEEPPRRGSQAKLDDRDVVPVYVVGVSDNVTKMFSQIKADVGARKEAMKQEDMTVPGGGGRSEDYESRFGSGRAFAPSDSSDPNEAAFDALKKLRTEAVSFQEGMSRQVEPSSDTHKEVAEAIQKVQEGAMGGKEFGDMMTELKKAQEIEGKDITKYWRMYRRAKADFFINEAKEAQKAVEHYSEQPGEEYKAAASYDKFTSNVKKLQEFIKSGAGKPSDIFTEGSRYIDPKLARSAGVWESPAELAKKSSAPLGDDDKLKNIFEKLTEDVTKGEGDMVSPLDKTRFTFRSLGDIKPEVADALASGKELEDLGLDLQEAWDLDEVVGNVSRLREALERFLKFNISDDFQSEQRKNIQMTIKQLKKMEEQYTSFGKRGKRFSDETIVEPVPRSESRTVQGMFNRLNLERLEKYFKKSPDRGGPREDTQYRYNEKVLDRLGTVQKSIRHTFEKTSDRGFTHRTKNLQEEGDTFKAAIGRATRWGAASRVVYGGMDQIGDMVNTIKEIESYMARLRMVMNDTETNFDAMKDSAVSMAKEYGVAIEEILQGMKIFAQQGLNQAEVMERTRAATLAANVTTLSAAEATEALTAATKIYGDEADSAMRYLDSWSEVESKHAITAGDLANALKKSAAAAKNAGVNFDELNGIIAGIGTVTRQSGKEVSTALRFIFRRLTSEKGPRALGSIGIPTITGSGELREGFDVLNDLANKWDDLNSAQKMSTAQAIGGTRQYNALLVLMDNWAETLETVRHSINSKGSAERRNMELMKTYEKQLEQMAQAGNELKEQFGEMFLPIAKTGVKALKTVLEMIANIPGYMKAAVAGVSAFIVLLNKGGNLITTLVEGFKEGKGVIGDFVGTAKDEFGKGLFELFGKDVFNIVPEKIEKQLNVVGGKAEDKSREGLGLDMYDFETFLGKAGSVGADIGRAFNREVGDKVGIPEKLFMGAANVFNDVGDILSGNVNPMDMGDIISGSTSFQDIKDTATGLGGGEEDVKKILEREGLKSALGAAGGAAFGTAGRVVGMPAKGIGSILGGVGRGFGGLSDVMHKLGESDAGILKSLGPLTATLAAMKPSLEAIFKYWQKINMTAEDYRKMVHDNISALSNQIKELKNIEFSYDNIIDKAEDLFEVQRKRTAIGGVSGPELQDTATSELYDTLRLQSPALRQRIERAEPDFEMALRNRREDEDYDWTWRDYPKLAGKAVKQMDRDLKPIADMTGATDFTNMLNNLGENIIDLVTPSSIYKGTISKRMEAGKGRVSEFIGGGLERWDDRIKESLRINQPVPRDEVDYYEPMEPRTTRREEFEQQVSKNLERTRKEGTVEDDMAFFGAFRSQVKLIEDYNKVANELGRLNTDLVSTYDELGNAILKTSDHMGGLLEKQKRAVADKRADAHMQVLEKYATSLSEVGGDEKLKKWVKDIAENDVMGVGSMFADDINLGSRFQLEDARSEMNEALKASQKGLFGDEAFEEILAERQTALKNASKSFNEELDSFVRELRNQEMFEELPTGKIIDLFSQDELQGGFEAISERYNRRIDQSLLSGDPYISGLGKVQENFKTTPRQVMISEAMRAAHPEESEFIGYNIQSTLGKYAEKGIQPLTGKSEIKPGQRMLFDKEGAEMLGLPEHMPTARIEGIRKDAEEEARIVLSFLEDVDGDITRRTEEISKENAEELATAILPTEKVKASLEDRKRLLYEMSSGAAAGISALSPEMFKQKIDLGSKFYNEIETSTLLQSDRVFTPDLANIGRGRGRVGHYGLEQSREASALPRGAVDYFKDWPKDFQEFLQEPSEQLKGLQEGFEKQKLEGLSGVEEASLDEETANDFRDLLDLFQNNSAAFILRKSMAELFKTMEEGARSTDKAVEANKQKMKLDKESAGLLSGISESMMSDMDTGRRDISDLNPQEATFMRSSRARGLGREYSNRMTRIEGLTEMANNIRDFITSQEHFYDMAEQLGLDIKPEDMEKYMESGMDKSDSLTMQLEKESLDHLKLIARYTKEMAEDQLDREKMGEPYRKAVDEVVGDEEGRKGFKGEIEPLRAQMEKYFKEGKSWSEAPSSMRGDLEIQDSFKNLYNDIKKAEEEGSDLQAKMLEGIFTKQAGRMTETFGFGNVFTMLRDALPGEDKEQVNWLRMLQESVPFTAREAVLATEGKEKSKDLNPISGAFFKNTEELMSERRINELTSDTESVSPRPSPWITQTNRLASLTSLYSLFERMGRSEDSKQYGDLLERLGEGEDWRDVLKSARKDRVPGDFENVESEEQLKESLIAKRQSNKKRIGRLDAATAAGAITGATQMGGHLLNAQLDTNISPEILGTTGHAAAGAYVIAKKLKADVGDEDTSEALKEFEEAVESGEKDKIEKASDNLRKHFDLSEREIKEAKNLYESKKQKDKEDLEKEKKDTFKNKLTKEADRTGLKSEKYLSTLGGVLGGDAEGDEREFSKKLQSFGFAAITSNMFTGLLTEAEENMQMRQAEDVDLEKSKEYLKFLKQPKALEIVDDLMRKETEDIKKMAEGEAARKGVEEDVSKVMPIGEEAEASKRIAEALLDNVESEIDRQKDFAGGVADSYYEIEKQTSRLLKTMVESFANAVSEIENMQNSLENLLAGTTGFPGEVAVPQRREELPTQQRLWQNFEPARNLINVQKYAESQRKTYLGELQKERQSMLESLTFLGTAPAGEIKDKGAQVAGDELTSSVARIDTLKKRIEELNDVVTFSADKLRNLTDAAKSFHQLNDAIKEVSSSIMAESLPSFKRYKEGLEELYGGGSPTAPQDLSADDVRKMVDMGMSKEEAVSKNIEMDQFELEEMRTRHGLMTGETTGKEAFEAQRKLEYLDVDKRLAQEGEAEEKAIQRLQERQQPFEDYYKNLTDIQNRGNLSPEAEGVIQNQREQVARMLETSTDKTMGGKAFKGVRPEDYNIGDRHRDLLESIYGKDTDKKLQDYLKELEFKPLLSPLNSIDENVGRIVGLLAEQSVSDLVKEFTDKYGDEEKEKKKEKGDKEEGKEKRSPMQDKKVYKEDKEAKVDKEGILGKFWSGVTDFLSPSKAYGATTEDNKPIYHVPMKNPSERKEEYSGRDNLYDTTTPNYLKTKQQAEVEGIAKESKKSNAKERYTEAATDRIARLFGVNDEEGLEAIQKVVGKRFDEGGKLDLSKFKDSSKERFGLVNNIMDILGTQPDKTRGKTGDKSSEYTDWVSSLERVSGPVNIDQPDHTSFGGKEEWKSMDYNQVPFRKIEGIREEAIRRRGEQVPGRTRAGLTGEGLDDFKEPRYDYGAGRFVGGTGGGRTRHFGKAGEPFYNPWERKSAEERGFVQDESGYWVKPDDAKKRTTLRSPATTMAGSKPSVDKVKGSVPEDKEAVDKVFRQAVEGSVKASEYLAKHSNISIPDEYGIPSENKGIPERTEFKKKTNKYAGFADTQNKASMEFRLDPFEFNTPEFLDVMMHETTHAVPQNIAPAEADTEELTAKISSERMEKLKKFGPKVGKLEDFINKQQEEDSFFPDIADGFTKDMTQIPGRGFDGREISKIKEYTGGYFGRKAYGSSVSEFNRDADFFRDQTPDSESANKAMAMNYLHERQAMLTGLLGRGVSTKTDQGDYAITSDELVQGGIFDQKEQAEAWANTIRKLKSNIEKAGGAGHIDALTSGGGSAKGQASRSPATPLGGMDSQRLAAERARAEVLSSDKKYDRPAYRADDQGLRKIPEEERRRMEAEEAYNRTIESGPTVKKGEYKPLAPRGPWGSLSTSQPVSHLRDDPRQPEQVHYSSLDDNNEILSKPYMPNLPIYEQADRYRYQDRVDEETGGEDPFTVKNMNSKAAKNYLKSSDRDRSGFEEVFRGIGDNFGDEVANKIKQQIENVEFNKENLKVHLDEDSKTVKLDDDSREIKIKDDSIKRLGEEVLKANKNGDSVGAEKKESVDQILKDMYDKIAFIEGEEMPKVKEEAQYLTRRQALIEQRMDEGDSVAAKKVEDYLIKSTNFRNLINSSVDNKVKVTDDKVNELDQRVKHKDEEFEHTRKEVVELRKKNDIANSKADEARNSVSLTERRLEDVVKETSYLRDIMSYGDSNPLD